MNSGSWESESVLEEDCNEGISLLVVGAGVAVPMGEGRWRMNCWQMSARDMSLRVQRWRHRRGRQGDAAGDGADVGDDGCSAGWPRLWVGWQAYACGSATVWVTAMQGVQMS